LELRKFIGSEATFARNRDEVWAHTSDQLQNDPRLTVQGLNEQSNLALSAHDDPWTHWSGIKRSPQTPHSLSGQSSLPDKAINITKPGYADYMPRSPD
jgi:glucuronate isomerase